MFASRVPLPKQQETWEAYVSLGGQTQFRGVIVEYGHLGQADWLSCVTACYPSADLEAIGAFYRLGILKDPEL